MVNEIIVRSALQPHAPPMLIVEQEGLPSEVPLTLFCGKSLGAKVVAFLPALENGSDDVKLANARR